MKPSEVWSMLVLSSLVACTTSRAPTAQPPITAETARAEASTEPLPATPMGPEPATRAALAASARALPPDDGTDFRNAERGLVAPFAGEIRDANGRVVWSAEAYSFEDDEAAPPTVHPSLWRQARLNRIAGLFEVTEGIYQVRGLDLSNMDLIEGERGLIVIDPLISMETARAALDLYYQHRPRRPVVAVIYSHSHVDHFGGVKGVVSEEDVRAGRVKVFAPDGFLEHAVSENVFVGNAMSRRALYMYGTLLPRSPEGQVDTGLGKATSTGTVSLIAPTDVIRTSGERRTIDGVEIVFQLTPGTEAPAEMNMYFPRQRALCAAENATHTLHNLLTLRGAEVRDPATWARYLNEAIALFGDEVEVMFAQHHWPTWGREEIVAMLSDQRDMYQYIHDQALHLVNQGLTPLEIAAEMETLPEGLAERWYTRGYYGSLSHNVRAVYQKYIGFYDGNPARLDPLPPVEAAQKYVEYMGGPDAVLARAREAFERGEYRWVAQVVDHVVFAHPDNVAAKRLEAAALEQMGYQTENATWRNNFLVGASELRSGVPRIPALSTVGPEVIGAIPPSTFFAYLGVRLDRQRAAGKHVVVNWSFSDPDERFAVTLRNGALTVLEGRHAPEADATVRLRKSALDELVSGRKTLEQAVAAGDIAITGDRDAVLGLFAMAGEFPAMFPIVTP